MTTPNVQKTRCGDEWRCYKPQNNGSGAASKIQVAIRDGNVIPFLVMSPQKGKSEDGNAKFSWSEKENDKESITLKLGENDIGELLAVLYGFKNKAGGDRGLFHKNERGSATISFEASEYNGEVRYSLKTTKKNDETGQVLNVRHSVTLGEGCILKIVLEKIVSMMYGSLTI